MIKRYYSFVSINGGQIIENCKINKGETGELKIGSSSCQCECKYCHGVGDDASGFYVLCSGGLDVIIKKFLKGIKNGK